ncbi:tetratricopeptide repeat protein [Sulfuriflexus sp.]|uniref:tetratricopeptide repeat protein n=1 Tax=Sulfuriflexus sp. TaxID=2015443 RepID=UPI0028CD0F43|nr:tetratricopeptide repeat protein [Sulfuriflexus sp.]MDT8403454.1 tetratricopeptide repeat protein [Sulfuriflexus sp.]
MKFSNNYIFYPDNKALEKAIEYYKSLVSDDEARSVSADNRVTVPDNFIYTRGNFEQHRYSANVFTNARDMLEATLTEEIRQQSPSDWAATQNSLGNILSALGQQQRDADLFNKAIACFNHALEVFSQEDSPLDWAATQSNLGSALQALGRQESDTKSLKKSIDAYSAALLEYSRKETPQRWASVMFQLGVTFHIYGRLLKGNRTFQKSVVAYKNALAEFDADDYALELTATHNNRGAVLHHLGESEKNPERLEEAIRAYETALTVCMEQQLPFHLAVLCRVNKATAQGVLAELTKDIVLADEVADEFELIIECFPHVLQPLCLKHCEEQLSKARTLLHN